MYGCRISVVGRLRTIYVVVRRAVCVISSFVSHKFQSTIGDYFVGIHIGACAGSALNHIYRELFVVLAVYQLLARRLDGFCHIVCEQTKLVIGFGCPHLSDSQTFDKQRILT